MRQNSWLLSIYSRGGASVAHGSNVEFDGHFIAEGAWEGNFSADGLLGSKFRCGSGAVRVAGGWIILPPSHAIEGVFCYIGRHSVIVSNSIHAIIAHSPDAQPKDIGAARAVALQSTQGRRAYPRKLYTTQAGTMLRFSFNRVFISNDGAICEADEASFATGAFPSFARYNKYLGDTLASILENARDTGRRSPYGELITTCSSGYDSPACAALAVGLGSRKAVTLTSGRGGADDSGRAVAEALGLECFESERFGIGKEDPTENGRDLLLPAKHLEPQHQDFLASVNTAEDLFFADFEPHFKRALVLTGFHGDYVWATGCPSGPEVRRGDASGTGLDEFRKRVGFINIPVPFIGAQYNEDIAKVTASSEMQPWRVPGHYSRPIPRRIAEDAGVPREAFGIRKLAGSILIKDAGEIRNQAFNNLVSEYRSSIPELTNL